MIPRPPRSTLFPCTSLYRTPSRAGPPGLHRRPRPRERRVLAQLRLGRLRSEEHTSELQSPVHLVCRHQLEKKKKKNNKKTRERQKHNNHTSRCMSSA